MPVIFLPGSDEPNEFTQRFKDASLQELIDAYNEDLPKRGWVSARGRFLAALGAEFRRRSVDSSLIESKGGTGLTLAFEVAYDEANDRLVPATELL